MRHFLFFISSKEIFCRKILSLIFRARIIFYLIEEMILSVKQQSNDERSAEAI
jgi:hypothetical protein